MSYKKTMQQIVTIWTQPIYCRLNIEGKKMLWLLVIIFPLAGLGVAAFGGWLPRPMSFEARMFGALAGFGAAFFVGIGVWYITLVGLIARQHTPANARLLPGGAWAMRLAIFVPVIVLPMLIGLIAVGGLAASFSKFWFGSFTAMLAITFIVRRAEFGFLPSALMLLPILMESLKISWKSWPIWDYAGSMVLSGWVLAWLVLRWLLRPGEHLHGIRESALKRQKILAGERYLANSGFSQVFSTPYFLLLQRGLRQRTGSTVLLTFALGPAGHPMSALVQLVATFGAVIAALLVVASGKDKTSFFLHLLFLGAAFLPMRYVIGQKMALFQMRAEQGLISLTPGSGSSRTQTKTIIGQILKHYFLFALCMDAVLMGYLHSIDADQLDFNLSYLLCACTLIPGLALVGNVATMSRAADARLRWLALITVAVFAASWTLLAQVPAVPVWLISAVIVVLTCVCLSLRWRKLMRLEAVFPAGRAA